MSHRKNITNEFNQICKFLQRMYQKFPSQISDARNMHLDIKKLRESHARTVDQDELVSILNQARAKLTLAKIKHKQVVREVEKEMEKQNQKFAYSSFEEQYRDKVKREQSEMIKDILSTSKEQKQILQKYKQMAEKFDQNAQEIIHSFKESGLEEKLKNIRDLQEQQMKERSLYQSNIPEEEKIKLETSAQQTGLEAQKQLQDLQSNKDGMKLDGIINVSTLTGEIRYESQDEASSSSLQKNKDGIQKYVIRKGKLIKGSAKKRTEAPFSNWHGGNADPEDIMRHRQLLDRQHFKGPVWDGVQPKSALNQDLNTIAMGQGETHPSEQQGIKEGKKEFQTVVR